MKADPTGDDRRSDDPRGRRPTLGRALVACDASARTRHRSKNEGQRVPIVLVLLVLGAMIVVFSPPSRASARTVQPAWGIAASSPPVIGDLTAVSCPTTLVCLAVGRNAGQAKSGSNVVGAVARTTDGGKTWVELVLPHPWFPYVLQGLSCPSSLVCMAVGGGSGGLYGLGVAFRTTDGGTAWQEERLPGQGWISGVSCPTVSECILLQNGYKRATALSTTDGGGTWRTAALPTYMSAVSCPSSTVCEAVGGAVILRSVNEGARWAVQAVPKSAATASFASLSCPTVSDCVAAGSTSSNSAAVLGTVSGGATWFLEPLPRGLELLGSIGCRLDVGCTAVGYSGSDHAIGIKASSTDPDSQSWKTIALPPAVWPGGVDCATASDCVVTGEAGTTSENGAVALDSTDGGKSWAQAALPSGIGVVGGYGGAITCPDTALCLAAADYIGPGGVAVAGVARITAGNQSLRFTELSSFSDVESVTCPVASSCYAIGTSLSRGGIELSRSTDGGNLWPAVDTPRLTDIASTGGMSCPTAQACWLLGDYSSTPRDNRVELWLTSNAGASWSSLPLPTGMGVMSVPTSASLSCQSTVACWMTGSLADGDGAFWRTADAGKSWVLVATTKGSFGDPTCYSATECVSLGTNPSNAQVLWSTSNGKTFAASPPSPAGTFVETLSCPAFGRCIGTEVRYPSDSVVGIATSDAGLEWQTISLPTAVERFSVNSIACPATNFCVSSGMSTAGGPVALSYVQGSDEIKGYWLVTSKGNVYNLGDAGFYGSEAGKTLPAPVVGIVATPDAKGYWLVTSKGNVYNLGDAGFYGSEAGKTLPAPVVSMAGTS
jgi:photosystem II stability/assembly factor-like uncharacterized protein